MTSGKYQRKKLEPKIDEEQFDKLTNLKKDIEEGQILLKKEREEFEKEREAVKSAQDHKIKDEVSKKMEDAPAEELSKDILLDKDVKDGLKLDDDKDYCNVCYQNGDVTELIKGQEYCPKCHKYLEW